MALTGLQRTVCRLLADNRIASGESYVAGGVALNELLAAARISRDVDLFHDTDEALAASWRADRLVLEANGFEVLVVRERTTFVEAEVSGGGDRVRMEWARDTAFRFFPLQRHEEFGLTLHPFDLATNKVLALVGRLEVRDWVDVIASHERVQPLGYLAWAACGKDPGFGPGQSSKAPRAPAGTPPKRCRSLPSKGSRPMRPSWVGRGIGCSIRLARSSRCCRLTRSGRACSTCREASFVAPPASFSGGSVRNGSSFTGGGSAARGPSSRRDAHRAAPQSAVGTPSNVA